MTSQATKTKVPQVIIKKKVPTKSPLPGAYRTTYKFIEDVGEFVKAKLGDKFPTTWGGFNVCMTPIPGENKYLFISRVFLNQDMLFSNKVIPGSKYSAAYKDEIPHMRPHDWSNFFPWGNWGSGMDMSIMFVGSFDATNGITLDKTYTPFLLTGCKSYFQKPPCMYRQAKELGIPGMLSNPSFQLSCSDFRIFTLGNEIIMHDAYTNYLNKVIVNHDKKNVRYERWVSSMCQLPTSITGKDLELAKMVASGGAKRSSTRKASSTQSTTPSITGADTEHFKNKLDDGAPYYKYFDKNWSFIGMQGENNMLFLDWFYEDGIHAVSLDTATGYCTRKQIVQFHKDIIPRDATETYPDFSLGTTTMSLSKNKLIDVLGVGHVKFHWDYISFNGSRLYKEIAKIDAIFAKAFGRNYKRHMKYVYAAFFYRIKQTSKSRFEMTMSNLWIPFFQSEKERYHSLVFFPMAVTMSLDNHKELHVSAGFSDYYNGVLTFDKEDVINHLVHDVSNMSMRKLNIDLIKY